MFFSRSYQLVSEVLDNFWGIAEKDSIWTIVGGPGGLGGYCGALVGAHFEVSILL